MDEEDHKNKADNQETKLLPLHSEVFSQKLKSYREEISRFQEKHTIPIIKGMENNHNNTQIPASNEQADQNKTKKQIIKFEDVYSKIEEDVERNLIPQNLKDTCQTVQEYCSKLINEKQNKLKVYNELIEDFIERLEVYSRSILAGQVTQESVQKKDIVREKVPKTWRNLFGFIGPKETIQSRIILILEDRYHPREDFFQDLIGIVPPYCNRLEVMIEELQELQKRGDTQSHTLETARNHKFELQTTYIQYFSALTYWQNEKGKIDGQTKEHQERFITYAEKIMQSAKRTSNIFLMTNIALEAKK